jgi:isochorismate synthase
MKQESAPHISFINTWDQHSQPGFGWVFYRFPDSGKINFSAGRIQSASIDDIIKPSFIIAPFYNERNHCLQMDSIIEFQFSSNDEMKEVASLPFYYNKASGSSTSVADYCNLVAHVLDQIEMGTLKKAVPARTKHIALLKEFSPHLLYQSLSEKYPNAFVYMLSTPETGTWIGCTPELLLNADGNNITTLSLAGTKKSLTGYTLGTQSGFTDKEMEEQDIVTEYICNILSRYCTALIMHGPELQKAGNVTHLATHIQATLMPGFESGYGTLLKALHPTPAVCGLPVETAMKMLLSEENFDRALYSGFIGKITDTSADIYVNLRCMQVFEHSAQLYAGAGVVKGSVPENEWLETEEKMETLLSMIPR